MDLRELERACAESMAGLRRASEIAKLALREALRAGLAPARGTRVRGVVPMATRFGSKYGYDARGVARCSVLSIVCAHGSGSSQLRPQTPAGAPLAEVKRRALLAVHQAIHDLISAHGRQYSCACAAPLRVFCWPRLERRLPIGEIAGGPGGTTS